MTIRITPELLDEAVKASGIPLITGHWLRWIATQEDKLFSPKKLCGACALSQVALLKGAEFSQGNSPDYIIRDTLEIHGDYISGFVQAFDDGSPYLADNEEQFGMGYEDGLACRRHFILKEATE